MVTLFLAGKNGNANICFFIKKNKIFILNNTVFDLRSFFPQMFVKLEKGQRQEFD